MDDKNIGNFFADFSHDLIGQIATIRIKKNILQEVLPKLVAGYNAAVSAGIVSNEIKANVLTKICELADNEPQVSKAIDIIEKAKKEITN